MSKRFTVAVPEALWPAACKIVAARGVEGVGMLNVNLIAAEGHVWYGCPAGGQIDDPATYNLIFDDNGVRHPDELYASLLALNDGILPFALDEVREVLAAAIIHKHPDGELVNDEFWATIGMTIVGVVGVPD